MARMVLPGPAVKTAPSVTIVVRSFGIEFEGREGERLWRFTARS